MKIRRTFILLFSVLIGLNLMAQAILNAPYSFDDFTKQNPINTVEELNVSNSTIGFSYALNERDNLKFPNEIKPKINADYVSKDILADSINSSLNSSLYSSKSKSTTDLEKGPNNDLPQSVSALNHTGLNTNAISNSEGEKMKVERGNSFLDMSNIIYSEAIDVTRVEPGELEDNSSNWDYYIIVGVFKNKTNLRNYQKYLFETFSEPTQMMVNHQNYYYLWTKKITTNSDASTEIERISNSRFKNCLVGNPWLWREPRK